MSTSTLTELRYTKTSRLAQPALRARVSGLLHRYAYPLIALTRREFARSYGRTTLGWGWMALQPALLLGLYVAVFGFVLRVRVRPNSGPGDFALYLMSGMLPYMALSDGIHRASGALQENRSLLDQMVFPAEVIPFAAVLGSSFTEVIGLLILAGAAGALGQSISLWLLTVPLLLLLRIALTVGAGCFVSTLAVFIPDVREVLNFLLTAWLFLTPIFYVPDAVPHGWGLGLEINPLYHLVNAYRAVLFAAPGAGWAMLKAFMCCMAVLLAGVWFFRKTLTRARDLL